jgi:hypothetical protein
MPSQPEEPDLGDRQSVSLIHGSAWFVPNDGPPQTSGYQQKDTFSAIECHRLSSTNIKTGHHLFRFETAMR